MTRCFVLLVGLVLLPSSALAHRAPPDREAVDDLAASERDFPDSGIGAMARQWPPGGLQVSRPTNRDVRAALDRAQGAISACLTAAAYVGSVRVAAQVETSRSILVTVTPRPLNEGVRACAELAAQSELANLASGEPRRTIRGSITVRRRDPAAPAPRGGADPRAQAVHRRLNQDRVGLRTCVTSAAPGAVGRATLHVTLQPDGSLALSTADLPTGVPAGPTLACLSGRIGSLHLAPAAGDPLPVAHVIRLGEEPIHAPESEPR